MNTVKTEYIWASKPNDPPCDLDSCDEEILNPHCDYQERARNIVEGLPRSGPIPIGVRITAGNKVMGEYISSEWR